MAKATPAENLLDAALLVLEQGPVCGPEHRMHLAKQIVAFCDAEGVPLSLTPRILALTEAYPEAWEG